MAEIGISARVEEKLAEHGVTADEVLEVLFEAPTFFRDKVDGRDMMIGKTFGGRLLTIVIEADDDQADAYDVITGWLSSRAERALWEKAK